MKQARYDFSAQEVKSYFTEDKVLDGLFGLIHSLYGLTVEADEAPTWHEDVRFFRLVDSRNGLVGQFHLDLYAREGKRGGAWMDDCRNRRVKGAGVQTPLVYLTCNFGKLTRKDHCPDLRRNTGGMAPYRRPQTVRLDSGRAAFRS